MDKVLICSNLLLVVQGFSFLATQLYIENQFSYLFVIGCIMTSAFHGSQMIIQCMMPIRTHTIGIWTMFITTDIATLFFNLYVIIFNKWQWWNWFLIAIVIHISFHLLLIILWHYRTYICSTTYIITHPSTYGAINTECCICLENIPADQIIILSCKHCFHSKCLHKWLKHQDNCPICRQVV